MRVADTMAGDKLQGSGFVSGFTYAAIAVIGDELERRASPPLGIPPLNQSQRILATTCVHSGVLACRRQFSAVDPRRRHDSRHEPFAICHWQESARQRPLTTRNLNCRVVSRNMWYVQFKNDRVQCGLDSEFRVVYSESKAVSFALKGGVYVPYYRSCGRVCQSLGLSSIPSVHNKRYRWTS